MKPSELEAIASRVASFCDRHMVFLAVWFGWLLVSLFTVGAPLDGLTTFSGGEWVLCWLASWFAVLPLYLLNTGIAWLRSDRERTQAQLGRAQDTVRRLEQELDIK